MLFVCSRNRWRSPTGEAVYADEPGIEVDSAGLAADAEVRLSAEQVEWAELIFVMENVHRERLNRRFGKYLKGRRVVVLGIADEYRFMDEALVRLIRERCGRYLK